MGGPIIKDKLFFFLSAEMGRRTTPTTYVINDTGASNDFGGANVTVADAQRFVDILKNKYGYTPAASATATRSIQANNDKIFFRLDYNINTKNRLTLRHNYINGLADNPPSKASSTRLRLRRRLLPPDEQDQFHRPPAAEHAQQLVFNELIVNYTTIRDARQIPDTLFPQVNVAIAGGYRLTAGTEQYSGANGLNQDILEITDNLTWTLGDHMLTLGTHNEFFKFANLYIRNLYGYWEFSQPRQLRERRRLALLPRLLHGRSLPEVVGPVQRRPARRLHRRQVGDPAQPQPDPRRARRRADHQRHADRQPDGRRASTASRPTRRPRATSCSRPASASTGTSSTTRQTQVRGGIGLFSGRTPYVWISNQFSNSGMDFTRLDIRNPAFAFVPDALNQPIGRRRRSPARST